jgi:hypothetical protein
MSSLTDFAYLTKIVNMYLYGTDEAISDKELAELRALDASTSVLVDPAEYMAGPGRFAVGAMFPIVQTFFARGGIPEGTYTIGGMAALLNLPPVDPNNVEAGYDHLAYHAYDFNDGADNYTYRTYIWNTSVFKTHEDATFVVSQSGKWWGSMGKQPQFGRPARPRSSEPGGPPDASPATGPSTAQHSNVRYVFAFVVVTFIMLFLIAGLISRQHAEYMKGQNKPPEASKVLETQPYGP